MSIQDRYLQAVIKSLSPYNKHKFRDGYGYKIACPFCRDAQKNESKSKEKCAAIYPVVGSFSYFFSCNRGLNGGKGNQECSQTMRFSTLLKKWTHPSTANTPGRKEVAKAVHCLGIHQVQEVPVLIHQSVSLACAPGTTLSSSVGIPFVVFGLVRMPSTELIPGTG